MIHNRPDITEQHIDQIRRLLDEHPDWHRTRLSKELCELWGWKFESGQLKDISCRDLLRSLDATGRIQLPPQHKAARKKGRSTNIQLSFHDESPVERSLPDVTPLRIQIVASKAEMEEYKSLIEQYHYLGYGQSVGECMRYMVRGVDGALLACLLFGSSAWRCAPRDTYIGWSDTARATGLPFTTNNTRFLILPWVRVPCLASHILSVVTRRVSQDWEAKYGHPLYLLETFVECGRFQGTSYKAANWAYVGKTTGRGRNSKTQVGELPIKDIYVYPLHKRFREKLNERGTQA
jgi:hypothetical protein